MATNYTGNVTPSLSNAPANAWTDDATKASHVGNTYLVTGSGGTAGNVYSFEEYAAPIIKSATGLPADIVTITDGGDNKNALKAEVSLSPIQSLNGYDHPWAGGAGKNKLADPLINGQIGSTGGYSSSTSRITNADTTLNPVNSHTYLAAGKYTLSVAGLNNCTAMIKQADGTITDNFASSWNNLPFTFTVSQGGYFLFTARKSNFSNISPSDYKAQVESGESATDWTPYSNLCPISGHTGATLKIGAEYPTADREYTSSFGQTVYGGTFDFVSGKLTVNMAMVDLGTLPWSYNGTRFQNVITGIVQKDSRLKGICSMYPVFNGTVAQAPDKSFIFGTTSQDIYVKDSAYTDAVAFTTAMSGVQLVYELATPIEIDLTPAQVQTLLGLNNVWASDGQITQFQYRSNQFQPEYNWFENWTMPKITRNNGNITVLPYPQEYTPEIYDVDAATTGRNAAGTMIRDRVARKHKFNYKFPPLSQADATEILAAVQDTSFTLTTASPETGAKTNYTVYVGDRSLPVYWMPNHDNASWLYSSLSLNLIEM